MQIEDFRRFIDSLKVFVASQDGKVVTADLELLHAGLSPFQHMDLKSFLQVLVHAQGVDIATIPGLAGKKPAAKASKAPKAKALTKNDAEAIRQAIEVLSAIHERYADPTIDYPEIRARAQEIHDKFDAGGLKEVAMGFGLSAGLSSKKASLAKIIGKIEDRRGSYERGQAIERAAGNAG